jgi:hypothetical protein
MYTVTPLKGEGAIRASVRKMSAGEASACANTVLSLYSDMLRLSDDAQSSLVLTGDDGQVVPPFLVKSVS